MSSAERTIVQQLVNWLVLASIYTLLLIEQNAAMSLKIADRG
jgi:hypothetical protein